MTEIVYQCRSFFPANPLNSDYFLVIPSVFPVTNPFAHPLTPENGDTLHFYDSFLGLKLTL
jgi:hypothetical protein